jgi:signal transduction histidine kinase
MIMKPGLRKFALTAHVTSSIGWFGAVAAFLALAIVGLTSQDRELVRAAYLAMELTTRFVIVPFAFVSGLTGVVSSLFTKWGLFRYFWVLVKLVITILATLILLVHTQSIELLAGVAAKTAVLGANLHSEQILMVNASSAALLVLLVVTALSYYKPRGMTRYGWRRQHEERKDGTAVDAAIDKAQGVEHEREGNGVHAAAFK